MELDKAFQLAIILSWEDVMREPTASTARVEYCCEPGTPLDNVKIWSSKAWGYHELACDYWTENSPDHRSGLRFREGLSSDKLTESLEFIMNNQDQFTRAVDAGRVGLVLVAPPTREESAEALLWMKAVRSSAIDVASAAD